MNKSIDKKFKCKKILKPCIQQAIRRPLTPQVVFNLVVYVSSLEKHLWILK